MYLSRSCLGENPHYRGCGPKFQCCVVLHVIEDVDVEVATMMHTDHLLGSPFTLNMFEYWH